MEARDENPAAAANVVVAIAGDPVDIAVAHHPAGIKLMDIICSTGQPCARIYQSTLYVSGSKNGTENKEMK